MPNDRKTVLIADDEPSTLALLGRHLRARGHQVLEASDGDQAWELAHEHLPDLVILDVMMPGMSGWEVCRRIREAVSLAHTGVLMLTGIGETLNEMTSPLYGADAYIDKPFEFGVLDQKIQETLASRQAGALGRPDARAEDVRLALPRALPRVKAQPKPEKAAAAPKAAAKPAPQSPATPKKEQKAAPAPAKKAPKAKKASPKKAKAKAKPEAPKKTKAKAPKKTKAKAPKKTKTKAPKKAKAKASKKAKAKAPKKAKAKAPKKPPKIPAPRPAPLPAKKGKPKAKKKKR